MGLDWMVETREDGTDPMATAGAIIVDADNPESVAYFEPIYKEHQANIKNVDPFGRYAKFWDRPMDTIMRDPDIHGKYLGNSIPEDSPARAIVGGMLTSSVDFRGKIVEGLSAVPEHVKDACYSDMEPDDACDMADSLEACRGDCPDDEVDFLDGAVNWLWFWGSRGHGIHAWF